MSSNLWIVSELYYPETTSTGYILTQIAEGLAAGHQRVSILCGQPSYSARGARAPKYEKRNGVNIHRIAATTLNKDVFLLRLVNLVTITISLFVRSLLSFRATDTVLVVTNPPSLPFLTALACKFRGARCVLLIHDVYPDVAIASGLLKADSYIARIVASLNRWLYANVNHIIVLGRDMKRLVAMKVSLPHERISVIPNWADLDTVFPVARNDNFILQQLDLVGKFVLQYAGNMGYPNDIESIVDAATLLLNEHDVHFLFIGSGAKQAWLEDTVKKRGLKNVTLLPPLPRSEQLNFLNACDIALISLVSGMKGVSVPSRTYNTLAAGKPILAITETGTELACIVEEEQVGFVVPPHCPNTLTDTILEAMKRQQQLHDMGQRARSIAEQKYSYQRIIQAYQSMFIALQDESSSI